MTRPFAICALAAMAMILGACGERVQTIPVGAAKKSDGKAWEASNSVYLAPGWTPGDQASWDAQLRNRAQAQNDFALAR